MCWTKKALSILLIFVTLDTSANHILGGNITYTCLGGDDYGITLTLYKDCFGATPATIQENVFFIPNGCSLPFSVNLPLQSVDDISDLCPSEIENSSCNGGFIPGTQQLTYYEEVTLDPACEWELSWAAGDWNYFINMDNGALPTAYIAATLNPTVAGCTDSAVPQLNLPIAYACAGDPVNYTLDIANPVGYTLDLSLVCPQTIGGADAPLIEPCDEPIPGLVFDDVAGTITFDAPMMFGTYAVAVQIDMFDGADYVGTIQETIAFVVRSCDATPTNFLLPEIQDINDDATQIADNEVDVCVGDSLCITVEAENANIFRSISLSSDFETLFPGGAFTQSGLNPASAELCVEIDESMIGSTTVTIDAVDDACINPTSDQIQVIINVNPSLQLSISDTLICQGSDVVVEAAGDSQFDWNPVSGDLSVIPTNDPQQTLSPSVTTEYEVTALNANPACNVLDTLTVNVAISSIDAVITDESCAGNDGAIDLTVNGAGGPYTFNWPATGEATEDISGLTGDDYTVTITDLALADCSRDTVITVESVEPPTGSIAGDATICEGACTDISFSFTGTGPFNVELLNEETGTLEATGVLNDQEVFEVCPSVTTTYTLQLVTDGNVPVCTYDVPSSVTITVRPEVTAAFADPAPICAGDALDLELLIDQAGSYEVSYDPNDGTPASPIIATNGDLVNVSPAAGTTYSITNVQYTDAPFCANTVAAGTDVIVNDLPGLLVSPDVTICEGEAVSFDLELTGTGPWELTHDLAGEASPIIINASPFTWNLANSPANTTSFELLQLTDAGTGCVADVNLSRTITVNPLPTAQLQADATVCANDNFDLVFALGANGPFDVDWSDGTNSFTAAGITDGHIESVNPNGDTQYCIDLVSDVNGCEASPASCVTLTETPLASAAFAAPTGAICAGECFDITFSFAAGSGLYTLEIEEIIDGTTTTSTLNVAAGDVYQVCPAADYQATLLSATDEGSGCVMDVSVDNTLDLTVTPIATVDASGDATVCEGECADLAFDFSNASGPVGFDLNGQTYAGLDLVNDMIDSVYIVQECPVNTTVYTLTNFTDGANTCLNILNDEVTITVNPIPDASFAAGLALCDGETGELVINVTNGPADLEISAAENGNTTTEVLDDVVDGQLYTVTPLATTTYEITSITGTGNPVCTGSPQGNVEVVINGTPEVIGLDTLCALTGQTFEFFFEITGGDPNSYSVDLPGQLVTNNGGASFEYTSDPLVPEDGHTFTITDANDCNPFTITLDPFSCPILTFAGTMDSDPLTVCDDGLLEAIHNGDEVLDPNDVLSFIIHSDPGEQLGVVYYVNDQPLWDVANDLDLPGTLQYGTEYYISAVAGDDDGSGVVDLGADVISIAAGTPFTIVEAPTAALSGGGTICEGETLELTVDFTGDGPYTFAYAIDGAEAPDSPVGPVNDLTTTFEVSDPGSYSLLSVENDACQGVVDGTADVIVNPLPEATLSGGGSLCEGENLDLQLELSGTGDWEVTIANDSGADGTIDFTETVTFNNAVSTYTVSDSTLWFVDSVADATGCVNDTDSDPVNVAVDPQPDAVFAFGDTSFCAGASVDVLIDLTGASPYTIDYSIDGTAFQTVANSDQAAITTNLSGAFCIDQVSDANGCVIAPGTCIQIDEVPIPLADAGADQTLCSGADLTIGTADVNGYTYEWNNSAFLDDNTLPEPTVTATNDTGVPEDLLFEVTVSDAQCSATDEVTVTVQPLPQAEAGEEIFICDGDEVQLNAAGGDAYQWQDNGGYPNGGLDTPNPTVSPENSDWFVVTVFDVFDCASQDSVFINVGAPLEAEEVFTDALCFEACDGSIELIVSGGFEPFGYTWSTLPETTATVDELCAGSYAYTVTDSIGCTLQGEVELLENPPYFLDDVAITEPACFEEATGIIDAESASAVTFTLLETGETNNLGIFNNLLAGDYTVTGTDAQGCEADTLVTLNYLSDAISMSVDIDSDVYCVGDEVSFSAEASGGDGNFTYQWYGNTPPSNPLSAENPYVFTMADSLTAFVVATDGNGCTSDTLSSTAVLPEVISVSVGPETFYQICNGECLEFNSDASGGNGQLQYTWVEFPANDTLATTPNLSVCPANLNQSEFVLFVTDGCNAPASDTITVQNFALPNVTISADTLEGCFPVTTNLVNATDESFFGICEWDMGDGTILPTCSDISYTYATPGIYEPSLTVTSNQGCVFTDTLDTPIEVYDYPDAQFTWTPNPVTTLDNVVDFINLSDNAETYIWDFGGLGASTEEEPLLELPPVDLATYEVCLIAENAFGCADTTCNIIGVQSETSIYVPNAFTPDNDGLNEVFAPVIGGGVLAEEYLFRIWNRWGDIVYQTTVPGEGWNGNYQSGGYYVQNDVYVWELRFRATSAENTQVITGRVTILR